ncbi:MAG: class I SAM-dependent methyltransferase [Bacteroidetes bacterium]|nr:class I SAM-dependent methyltransferase [Bacteroidota bacterium]
MEHSPYLYSFLTHDILLTEQLELEAEFRDDIQPFVERETAKLISLLIRLTSAKQVLELGTGIAYSTIWLGGAVKEVGGGGKLITIDNHERTGIEAKANIEKANLSEVVELRQGDAGALIPKMAKSEPAAYDIIFQDCGKYLYPLLYEDLYTLLKPGGLLITDDTLFRVHTDIRKGLGKYVDTYNKKLFADTRYYSTMLPVGHGFAVSLKIVPGVKL